MLIVKCSVMIKTNIVIKGKVILFYRWKRLNACIYFDKGNGVRARGYDRSYGVEPEALVTL